MIATILAALTVGFLYGGKTWCQYFCPMAPVQKIYAEPRGLLCSTAHEGDRQLISQSTCRTVTREGKEQNACIGCQSSCIDIDAERSYWRNIGHTQQQWLYYGYVGIVIGYFLYYYFYSGNWAYYLSGAWAHEEAQLANLLKPGLYLFNQAIAIPKLIAVPIMLAIFTLSGYVMGCMVENFYKAHERRHQRATDTQIIRHRMFTLCTFFAFNFFFAFVGMSRFVRLLPPPLAYIFSALTIVCSSLWLYRNWQRSPSLYQREGMAHRLRAQLQKQKLDFRQALEGRSLNDLNAEEIYVLAKVLPNFARVKQQQAYKRLLKGVIGESYLEPDYSLYSLQKMRHMLDISNQDYENILTELIEENADLFEPPRQQYQDNLNSSNDCSKDLQEAAATPHIQPMRYVSKSRNPFLQIIEYEAVNRES